LLARKRGGITPSSELSKKDGVFLRVSKKSKMFTRLILVKGGIEQFLEKR
jgi:hypothetical protein